MYKRDRYINFTINNSTGFSFNKDIASPCHAHTSSRDNNESVMKKTVNSLRKNVLSIEDSVVKENYTLHVKKNTMINNTTNSTDVAFPMLTPTKKPQKIIQYKLKGYSVTNENSKQPMSNNKLINLKKFLLEGGKMQKQKIFLSLNGRANYPGYSNNGISSSIVNTEPTNRCRKDGNSILNNLPKLKLKY